VTFNHEITKRIPLGPVGELTALVLSTVPLQSQVGHFGLGENPAYVYVVPDKLEWAMQSIALIPELHPKAETWFMGEPMDVPRLETAYKDNPIITSVRISSDRGLYHRRTIIHPRIPYPVKDPAPVGGTAGGG
jgi:hypothetical protein